MGFELAVSSSPLPAVLEWGVATNPSKEGVTPSECHHPSSSASKSKVPIPDVTLVLVDPPLSLHAQSHKKSVLKGLKDPTNHRLPTIQPLKRKRRGKHLDSTTMGATETTSLVANGNGVHKKDDEDMKRLKSYQPCAYRDRIGPSISNEKIHHESPTGPASRSV